MDPERGLDEAEAARRLSRDGPNRLRGRQPTPLLRRVLGQFHDPLIYLLLFAAAISLAAWFADGAADWPVDALVIAAIVIANAVLGAVQEVRAQNAVAALARLTEATSSVLREGRLRRIPGESLVCGDVLVLAEGDAVGADARLFEAPSLRVQEASLTGESEAVDKDPAPLAAPAALADRSNMVFAGTAVVQGSARAIVTATGMRTELGAIAGLLEAAEEPPTPLEREIERIGRLLGVAVVAVAAIVVATVLLLSQPRSASEVVDVLLLGVSLAVAAVPEGLPAILSLVLALGVQRMARRNAIVKKLSSVETLGSASVIASDKTGTLTRSEMTVERVMTASGATHVTGVGYAPEGRLEYDSVQADDAKRSEAMRAENVAVLCGGSLAGNAVLQQAADGSWRVHGDPTEAAFLVAERKAGFTERRERRFERIAEIAFSSERKRMSSIEIDRERGGERVLVSKGAPDVLVRLCDRVRVGAEVVPLDEAMRARILADVDAMSDDALRTLSVACRPLSPDEAADAGEALERNLIFAGTVGIIDPPRAEVGPAIADAHRAGIRVIMITGDHPHTALRIAQDLGIAQRGDAALSGAQIDGMDAEALARAARRTNVYARVAPVHKLRIVDALQADGHVVAMTGDGVNDAPALKSADIGIAMGITGTEVTRQAARMILADDNFATIVAAVREGRIVFENIRKFLRYLLSSNLGEVLTVFLGVVLADAIGLSAAAEGAGRVALPLLATQILWINLITDSGPALAMGIDPAIGDPMARAPRRPGERVIDARMWASVLGVGAVMAAATLLTLDAYLPGGWIEGERDLSNARTAAFTTLVFAQLFNCLNARSASGSAFRHLFVNRWLWAAIALSVLLQVACVELAPMNAAFGTVPLTSGQWLFCAAMASVVLWFSELAKALLRAFAQLAGARRAAPAR
ncbi:MAG: cation-translocating P-type ATPase [Burkholderiaceae bacterium]|nr:cation-translocating P-type ATPase [Burkholderiaceae bacterium]